MHTTITPQQSLSQSDATIMIDDFVADVLYSTGLAFKTDSSPDAEINRGLRRYTRYLRAMVNVFDGWVDYDFGESLELFNDTRLEMRLEDLGSRFTCPAPDGGHRFLSEPECFNLLIERIRENSQSIRYIRGERDLAHESRIQAQELEEYVNDVLEVYPHTMVVRVNLCYMGVIKPWLKVGDVFADRCRLLNVIAIHPVFAHLSGYVLRIEQTDKKGFYIHAVFFYDASEVKNEAYRAQRIGELWTEITQGKGCWDDIGQSRDGWNGRGRYVVTGVFRRVDAVPCRRVAQDLATLAPTGQYLRIKPENGQAFITGRWPSNQRHQTALVR